MSQIYIPPKPAGGSLDLEMLVNYQFPYMHKAILKGQVMPGVAYDYAVALIQQGKARVAGVQIASKVNDDGSTGEEKKAKSPSVVQKLNWGPPKAKEAKEPVTKDDAPKESKK